MTAPDPATTTTSSSTPQQRTSSHSTLDIQSAKPPSDSTHLANDDNNNNTTITTDDDDDDDDAVSRTIPDEERGQADPERPALQAINSGLPASSIAPSEPEAQRTRLETALIVFALCLALFLAALDMTIITTAVPSIAAHFGSSSGYVWIGSAYMLGNTSFVATWGKISDVFGRKPSILAAAVIFWIGSLLCGVSTSMGMLIAARAIQGVGGGGLIVLPNICVSDLFSMRNRGLYFGIFGMIWALASAIGPVLGGLFTTKVSWRWCFYINLPISGVGMLILIFILKLHNPRTPIKEGLAAIDWSGSVLVIGGTIMLLIGLEFGGVLFPWASATVICLIVFGVFTIGLFILNESKIAKYPIIPLYLFKTRNAVACYTFAFCHAFVFMSGSYWLPLYFQSVGRADSLMSGVYLLPYVLSLSFVSGGIGWYIKKTGLYKIPIMVGMAITVLGFGLFSDLGPHLDWPKVILYQIVAGIGVGPNFQSALIAIQTNVEPRDIGSATSSFSFIRQMGTAISVVVGGVIFNNEMQKQAGTLERELGPELAAKLSGNEAAASTQIVGKLQGRDGEIARGAYWNALRTMYIVYTAFAALGLFVSFFIVQNQLSKKHKEHKTGLKSLKNRKEGAGPAPSAAEDKVVVEEK
ncbi:hypothetical protein NLU13_8015 [Sarocladium strictum]|uniref:Efflux pump dotC n=1 Tax=Sarocladium strictum TaxID=5046 RepID=A0AA39GBH6_SARSR|nr:hypothetical protein NLU13_8015 [Sarocladium strictum]